MTYTYGPVSSWRYGRSLGIDVITQPKKCTFNCTYCQLGPTKEHVVEPRDIQDEMPSPKDIVQEVAKTVSRLEMDSIDAVTFSGSGEPTLNPHLGSIVSGVREVVMESPIILLTNASLIPRPEVRANLSGFDIITAKLDAGDDRTFRLINHPAKGVSSLTEIVDSLKHLHRHVSGLLALEVMLLRGPRGMSNVEGTPRKMLMERILEIRPEIVQVYTPWRPTANPGILPVSDAELRDFGNDLGQHLSQDRIWVYGVHDARGRSVVWKRHRDLETEVVELLERRPCRAIDVAASLGMPVSSAVRTLRSLTEKSIVIRRLRDGHPFYETVHS
ncbi:MAG: radical SAM protein [Candidatus Thorarchaeota archaeon]|nr:MAG: hypothetical protein DRP09_15605 [Candidatus Thorarchaeota archaeon]RLI60204.1 MAG: hypothetical protein DRO87_00755 [Candidatus Thorarchaeota archaeon]